MTADGLGHKDILINCLDMWDAGVAIERILAQYPAQADELRPMLDLLPGLTSLAPLPSQEAQAASRARFLSLAMSGFCLN